MNFAGYGSSGWQDPEQLLHGRQTRAVDIFSLGCVLFFCMTDGSHPFGSPLGRDINITKNKTDLFLVEHIPEAVDLFFEQQMEVLGRLRHPNLVGLKAYYFARDEKLLVYDFMTNGNLFWLLHDAIRSKDIRKEDVGPMVNLENPTSPKEDRYDHAKMKHEEAHKPVLQRQDEFARPPSVGETHFPEQRHRPPHETKGTDHEKLEDQGLHVHKIGAQASLKNPHASHFPEERHRSAFAENKVIDHATVYGKQERKGLQGHENIGAPTSLENPNASLFCEEMHRPHVAADTHETKDTDYVTAHAKLEDQGLVGHKIGVPKGIEEDPHAPKDQPEFSPNPSNY